MKTMIVGGGGREHALAMAEYEAGSELYFPTPNAGMAQLGEHLWTPTGVYLDSALAEAAAKHGIDLAIIGPEAPLASGLADRLREKGVSTLGFGAEAAQLEASKVFSNEFMEQYGINRPATVVANNLQDGMMFIKGRKPENYVIKADGLAGGKGVILPHTENQARDVLINMMSQNLFDGAGKRVLFQERLHGQEVSMMALFDGRNAEVLFLAQDFKRLKDKDKGPNTGGMGSYAPITEQVAEQWQIYQMYGTLEKTLDGLKDRGITDPGVIYIGFMLADEFNGEPAVMEYNVRFGDPETQAGLTLLQDAGVNVHELIAGAANGDLGMEGEGHINTAALSGRAALTVCLATPGYPEAPRSGQPIYGLGRDYENAVVHHAATKYQPDEDGRIFTSGGRVLYVTGLGDSLQEARQKAYEAIGDDGVSFDGMQVRSDIGKKAIKAIKKAAKETATS
ncbi:MAG TPA: phosphoribosylamine--glycine ligase [Candidatus Saccharimonadales bacterium]|nr:phosphoribosylamine--glycine ligase [Candidatus Saccharimonadales bacterium]